MTPSQLPQRLSPSRVKDYIQCPKLFYFKSVLGLSTPPTTATLRGNLAHTAFELVFDRPAGDRGPERALSYARAALEVELSPFEDWSDVSEAHGAVQNAHGLGPEMTVEDQARWEERSAAAIRLVGDEGLGDFRSTLEGTVSGWYGLETPGRFDPEARELHVVSEMFGVTVHGYIDRLDRLSLPSGDKVFVSDYKTGKMPSDRFRDEAFFQLEIYALLLAKSTGTRVDQLRLLYTTVGTQDGVLTRDVDQVLLARTEQKLKGVWDGIKRSSRTGSWEARKQPLCNWCHFKPVCPAFNPELEGMLPEEMQERLDA